MTFDRREFLRRTGLAVTALSLAGVGVACTEDDPDGNNDAPKKDTLPRYEYDGPLGPETLFQHGVASGDPTANAIILWTRASVESEGPVEVWWEIGTDIDFEYRVDVGTFTTDATRDYTVKIDTDKLAPGTTYYYRFKALGRTSPIGRTRTAPEGDVDQLRFGVVSCANYTSAYFHAYGYAAKHHDLDAILHLGDYIYEYGAGGFGDSGEPMQGRLPLDPPTEIISLDDYRRRYACYRRDENLQEIHRQFPFIIIWDDHETANNAFKDGAQNHDEDEGPWEDRRDAGVKAFFEWQPVRDNDEERIWRTISYGNLVDLIMLDTRLWGRDEQDSERESHFDPNRSLLGADQESWLNEQLQNSKATWKIIGQQVMMSPLKVSKDIRAEMGNILNNDQWDGYEVSREKVLGAIRDNDIENVVVLTGDIHTSWAMDLTSDPTNPEAYTAETGEGAVAVEFVTPGISSPGLRDAAIVRRVIERNNPHIKWYDVEKRGYLVLDVTKAGAQSTWYLMEDAEQPQTEQMIGASYSVKAGEARVIKDDAPNPPPAEFPPPAP